MNACGGSSRWPVFAGYQCRALEPSSLGESLVVLARVHYQVGFASLEPNPEVAGGKGLPVMSVAALPWWSFSRCAVQAPVLCLARPERSNASAMA